MAKVKVRLTMEYDEESIQRADELADRLGEKRSTIMRFAMRIGLDELPQRLGMKEGSPEPED